MFKTILTLLPILLLFYIFVILALDLFVGKVNIYYTVVLPVVSVLVWAFCIITFYSFYK